MWLYAIAVLLAVYRMYLHVRSYIVLPDVSYQRIDTVALCLYSMVSLGYGLQMVTEVLHGTEKMAVLIGSQYCIKNIYMIVLVTWAKMNNNVYALWTVLGNTAILLLQMTLVVFDVEKVHLPVVYVWTSRVLCMLNIMLSLACIIAFPIYGSFISNTLHHIVRPNPNRRIRNVLKITIIGMLYFAQDLICQVDHFTPIFPKKYEVRPNHLIANVWLHSKVLYTLQNAVQAVLILSLLLVIPSYPPSGNYQAIP